MFASYDPDPDWLLVQEGFDARTNKHYEGAMAQGSGFLQLRASFEEGLADEPQDAEFVRTAESVTVEKPRFPVSRQGTFVPGVVGRDPLLNEVLLNLPFAADLAVFADGERFDLSRSRWTSHRRELDLRDGVLSRSAVWEASCGAAIELRWKRLVSMARPSLVYQELEARVLRGSAVLRCEAAVDGRCRTNGRVHTRTVSASADREGSAELALRTLEGVDLLYRMVLGAPDAAVRSAGADGERTFAAAEIAAAAGDAVLFSKRTVVATSRDGGVAADPGRFRNDDPGAFSASAAELYREHRDAWASYLERAGVEARGDPSVRKALRFSVYHLLRAPAKGDPRVSVCAKGHAGEAYFGRVFWDVDIYLLPFYCHAAPEIARDLVLFRCNCLDGARRNARRLGYPGARFPWESGTSGDEQCALWQYADGEVHITADVAYAIAYYAEATGDDDFLRDRGLEVLAETARYWLARIDFGPDGRGHLLGVMGPDEYKHFTRDNAYTVRMVQENLRLPLRLFDRLWAGDPDGAASFLGRIGATRGELEILSRAADSLRIPTSADGSLVLQCAEWEDYADIDIGSLWKDPSKPFGASVSQERIYRSKALKQADVLALMMMFPKEFSPAQVRAAFDHYEPRTTHDSSLSPVVHALVAARIGEAAAAGRFLRMAAALDLDAGRGGAAEGVHIANCGALWQAAAFGRLGLSFDGAGTPSCAPRAIDGLDAVSLAFERRGRRWRTDAGQGEETAAPVRV